MHISADVQRITLNALSMTISGERTEQLDIFCCVTGFTSDFLSFVDVELIWFFHGAIQMFVLVLKAEVIDNNTAGLRTGTLRVGLQHFSLAPMGFIPGLPELSKSP